MNYEDLSELIAAGKLATLDEKGIEEAVMLKRGLGLSEAQARQVIADQLREDRAKRADADSGADTTDSGDAKDKAATKAKGKK